MSGSGYMTADDLMNLRRPPDPPDTQPVGEKWYLPTGDEAEHATVEALLEERRALLEQERAARIGDLIVAEWNNDLKKSVTSKLKGKFTHHVGHALNGKIMLSPEETVFLLECGLLELHYGGMPLSTEEAYSIVLSGHLAIEKYQVYAYLSRLGFTVVSHHEKLGDVTSYERQMNLGRQKRKRRKQKQHPKPAKKANVDNELSNVESSSSTYDAGQLPAATFPQTTFRNALGSNSEARLQPSYLSNHTEIQANEVSSMSKGEDASGAEQTDSERTDVEGSESTPMGAPPETEEESEKESAPSVNSVVEPSDRSEPEAILQTAAAASEQNVQEEPAEAMPSRNQIPSPSPAVAKLVPCAVAEQQLPKSQGVIKCGSKLCNSGIITSTEKPDQAQSNAVLENEGKGATFEVCEEVDDDEGDNEEDYDEEEEEEDDEDDDGEEEDDDDDEEDFEDDEDESYTEDDDVVTDESCNSVIRIDNENESCEPTDGDADVVFIEVSKKENEPLAVISLLSDEEEEEEESSNTQGNTENVDRQKPAAEEEEEEEAGDDDEIQIIKECTPSVQQRPTVLQRHRRKPEKKAAVVESSSVKDEDDDGGYPLPRVDTSFNESVTWQFPNLLKKTVICLPRPPPHLLPLNVHLSKEAYTIDLRKLTGSREQTPRVWESYRDLQARRVASQQPNSNFRGPVWSVPPTRPFQPSSPNFASNSEPCSRTYSPHGRELLQQNSHYGSPAPPPSHGAYVKPEDVNRNSPVMPLPAHLQQPQTQFLKSEMESHHSPLHPSVQPQFPYPHQQITDYVSVATRAAMQAAQNALMSFTQRMNMQVNGCHGAGSAGMSFTPQYGRGAPPAHSYPAIMDQVRRNFPTPDSTTDFHGAACLAVGMQPVDSRRSDSHSAFHQGDGRVSSPVYGGQRNAFVPQGDDGSRSGSGGAWTRGDAWEEPYPSEIPRGPRHASSWREFKASIHNAPGEGGSEAEADNEVIEVPINVHEVLWSKNLSPLVKLEAEHSSDILQSLQITQSADLTRANSICEKFLPTTCNLEISFDVYLPGVMYRKSCPSVPNHRIVVVRSTDPFPKTSDIVLLQQKFSDRAILQFAVVDGKDVAFYSLNFVSLPVIRPGEETETNK